MNKSDTKKSFYHPAFFVQNARGSTIITTLIVASVIAIGVGFLADRILSQQKLSRDLSTDISYSIAVQSVTDYARYALKHKWCFPAEGNSVDPDSVSNCSGNYTHPRSLNRLLLPLKYARTLHEFKKNTDNAGLNYISGQFPATAEDMLLDEFTIESTLDNLGASHPLKIVLDNVKGKDPVRKIRIKYESVSDINLPSLSDQKYIRITTSLLNANDRIIQNGAQKASETELIYTSAREVNYFSLILKGNLFLGKTGNINYNDGDGYIPAASNSARGVSFYGPVFVNRNIVLPSSTYSPVGFYEPVILGSGYIGQGTTSITPFQNSSPLGTQRVWSDTGLFRGFFSGIDIDGTVDVGLDAIAGAIASSQTNNETVSQCIQVLREANEVSTTAGSFLFGRQLTPSTLTSRNYRLSFLKNNDSGFQKRFHPQIFNDAVASVKLKNCSATDSSQVVKHDSNLIDYCHQAPLSGGNTRKIAFSAEVGVTVQDSPVPAIMTNIPLLDATSPTEPGKTIVHLKSSDTATNSATVEFEVSYVRINNTVQPHFRDIKITVSDLGHIGTQYIPFIKLIAYDNTCQKGVCASPGSGASKEIFITKFSSSTQANCLHTNLYNSNAIPEDYTIGPFCPTTSILAIPSAPNVYVFPSESYDYGTIVQRCETNSATNMSGVNSSKLEKSFAENSADGWYYNNSTDRPVPPDPYPNRTFNSYDATASNSSGIYEVCTVPSSVNRVIGNWVCRKLNIESRSNPLQFIGTMIVTNNLYMHPSAVNAGVYFYSVHHPAAVQILRDAQVLKTSTGASCASLPTPHWHPDPGLQTLSDRISCSPISTFNGADPIKFPMRWTSISADCGYLRKIPGADPNLSETEPTCIKKINNYFFQSLERQYVK